MPIHNLTWLDYSVVVALVGGMIAIGLKMGARGQDTQAFFLARRSIPWWAACLSFVATEVSAVTLISVPSTAYRENWQYAQFFIGSTLARAVIAYLFIPAFYKYNCTTIYEFLMHRFGPATQYAATAFFFITRLLASGVRLTAAALAISVLLHISILEAVALFTIIGIAYILYGGIGAVVWTGVMQASIFIVAGLASIAFLISQIPGGLTEVIRVAGEGGRLHLWNLGPSWTDPEFAATFFRDPNILWIAILNGFFGSMAAFGTDHELMQRLLTVETRKASQRTMMMTPLVSFFVLSIFLSVGTCLFAYYGTHPEAVLPTKLDAIFPHFIGQVMPELLRGLLLAAIVMASIDSPLASLTASFVTDIYKPLIRPNAPDAHYLWLSRVCVVTFAVILGGIAYAFSFSDKILWLVFKIGGVTFGSLLGIFLLGLMTKRTANHGNVIAMVLMALVNAGLLYLSETKRLPMGWSWLVIIGTVGTFGLGYLFGSRTKPHLPPLGSTRGGFQDAV